MRVGEFEALLDRRGPAVEAWPAREREAASALLAGSPAARAALARARALDGLLARGLAPEPAPETLRAALERSAPPAAVSAPPAPAAWRRRLRLAWGAGLALATASLLAGFVLGALEGRVLGLSARPAADISGLVYGADLVGML